MRDDLRKQFTADSDDNPFAVFQRAWLGAMKQRRRPAARAACAR